MPQGPFVAYFCALSGGSEASDLEAQRRACDERARGRNRPLIGAFGDQSGEPLHSRPWPELRLALALAQQESATVILARFSPLSRNLAVLRLLIEARVEVVALDVPSVSRRTLPLIAALAEGERNTISEATRAGLAKAKAEGQRLGAHGATQARLNKAAAFQRVAPLAGALGGLIGEGLSIRAMAARLNAMQIPSPGGGGWHASTVHRALTRLAPDRFGKGRSAGARA